MYSPRHLVPSLIALALVTAASSAATSGSGGAPSAVDEERVSRHRLPRVVLETELGDIVIEVDNVAAPLTSENFLAHVDEGLYADARFYRVVRMENQPGNDVKIEVIQGGLGFDATSPRSPIAHETTEVTGLHHLDGTVSMARLGPGTASSEFFICIGDQPELDYGGRRNPDGQGFAAFGRVVSGLDTVRRIQRLESDDQMLVEPVVISRARRLP